MNFSPQGTVRAVRAEAQIKKPTLKWDFGGEMGIRMKRIAACLRTTMLVSLLATGSAFAQDSTKFDVRYCGLGLQGTAADFTKSSPNLVKIYKNQAKFYNDSFQSYKKMSWNVNLVSKDDAAGKDNNLGLVHVLTSENTDTQSYIDPRDNTKRYNVSYSFGINTVLFDVTALQVKAVIPSIINYNESYTRSPTPVEISAAYAKIFNGFSDPNSALSRWVNSVSEIPLNNDIRGSMAVAPVVLSDAVKAELVKARSTPQQSPEAFARNLTAKYEALLAKTFKKPIVPVVFGASGDGKPSSQYVANIPECLGANQVSMGLPDPSYELQLQVDVLDSGKVQHALPEMADKSRGTIQTELGYGGRYITRIVAVESQVVDDQLVRGGKVLDERTFKYARSLRFTGDREINSYGQYEKLSSSFLQELLNNYTTQDKKWIKSHMSAAVTDKKARDNGAVAKSWKKLIAETMLIKSVADKEKAK
ncbi:MAG: hypothetical protein RLZZ141_350 [Pseudomonadota bacterium]